MTMHTVVIQLQDQPQDWHLVEPFFYKVRSTGQLSFFKIEKSQNYHQLYVNINRHLSQERVSKWQVIVTMYVPTMSHGQISITKQLNLFSENLLKPFSEQNFIPDNVVFIVLDPLKRDSAYAPEDEGAHPFWQLDNFGYYTDSSKLAFLHNMFVQEELEQLDEAWGNGLDLKKAGLLERPDPEYLEMIVEKKQRVLAKLEVFIQEKKQFAKDSHDQVDHEHLTEDMLDEIYELFEARLVKLIQPALSLSLSAYRPSQQLENILKDKVSLLSILGNMKLVRQDFLGYTVEKRTKALVSVALFINALATEKDLVEQIPKGTICELAGVLNNEKLSEMLTSYYSCLKAAKVKIKSKIFERQTVTKIKLEDVKAPPYSADPLQEITMERLDFSIHKRLTFLENWQSNANNVTTYLDTRQQEIIEQAKLGWKNLDIIKRRALTEEGEEVEIQNYLGELADKVHRLYAELDELEPGENKEQSKWKKFIEKKGFDLQILVKACPTRLQASIAFGLTFIFLLGPHLYTLNWQTNHFRENWFDYMIIPLIFTGAVIGICLILKEAMENPIKQLLNNVRGMRDGLFEQQHETHSKYNSYLNKLYELYRVRQQYLTVKEQYEKEKQQNYFYRYHQSRIDEFIDSCEHFMSNLGLMRKTEEKRFYEFFEAKFSPDKDVIDNPIYSPFDYQTAAVKDTFDVKFIKDQVYSL